MSIIAFTINELMFYIYFAILHILHLFEGSCYTPSVDIYPLFADENEWISLIIITLILTTKNNNNNIVYFYL